MEKKVILITGASSGMGKVTAIDLANQGHIVYGAARHTDKMKELEKAGGHAIGMDMSKESTIKKGVGKVIKEQGRIDVLWNNAGFAQYGPVEEVVIDKARYQFEVNIFGLARITQLVLPFMRKQKEGLIINTSSVGGKVYTPLGAWYHATKHALEGWSDCLRLEVKQFGIDVVILEPGIIRTNFTDILESNLPEKVSKGPYGNILKGFYRARDSIRYSTPDVISKEVQKIIKAKKPKTRYAVGSMAKPMLFVRKWLGDRFFDKLVMSMLR